MGYFTVKLHSKRVFVTLANEGQLLIPRQIFAEIQQAYATMAGVVLVFFDYSSQTFDGYALVIQATSPVSSDSSGMVLIRATLIRRAIVKFSQVTHVKDDHGLRGRPLSAVRDGSRLGTPAGRVLCRFIDKKAYSEDPVHYRDHPNFIPNLVAGAQPNVYIPTRADTDLLNHEYSQYLNEFAQRQTSGGFVPTLDNLVYR